MKRATRIYLKVLFQPIKLSFNLFIVNLIKSINVSKIKETVIDINKVLFLICNTHSTCGTKLITDKNVKTCYKDFLYLHQYLQDQHLLLKLVSLTSLSNPN